MALILPAAASADSFTFSPVADAYVRSDLPDQNFGKLSTLRVDKDPTTVSYLRFDVRGLQGPVTSATLRLRTSTSATTSGVDMRSVADNAWGESALTYTNAPTVGGTIVSHVGAFSAGQWIAFNATSLVQGDGVVSMALTTTSTSSRGFQSREDVANAAQLIVEADDELAPAVSLDTPGDGALLNARTPTFSGSAGTARGDSTTVTVKIYAGAGADGTPIETTTATRMDDFWSATPAAPLDDGVYTVQAEQLDAAGNLSSSRATTFTVAPDDPGADNSAPAVTLDRPADGSSTIDVRPTFGGAIGTEAGDSNTVLVKVYAGDTVSGSPLQTLKAAGVDGSWSATATSPLTEGSYYTARAEQIDSAGNLGQSASATFQVTAPIIAAAGDIACDPASTKFNSGLGTTACRQKATSNLLVDQGLAAVLPLGDEQYECSGYSAYLASYDLSWGRVNSIARPVVGNHEYQTAGGTDCDATGKAGGYFQYFGAAAHDPATGYYSYDLGSWHIVALNTNDACKVVACSSGSAQEKWLKADLAAHPAQCTLAYWHAPRFRSGQSAPTSTYKALWNALYAARVDVVVNAHIHNYERFAPQDPSGNPDPVTGIREFVAGTGGASHAAFGSTIAPNSEVRDATAFGVLKLTLRSGSYDWRFVPEAGKTFTDSGTTNCH